MIKRIPHAFASAMRDLFRRRGTLLVLFVLYLAVLGAIYWFFVTREATIGQLILSLLLALGAPVLFLTIQTMAARYDQANPPPWGLLGGSFRDFWKLFVMSLPLILVAVLAIFLFGEFETTVPATAARDSVPTTQASPRPVTTPKPPPASWDSIAITTIKYLLFCMILPLAAIHLWISTAREGLKETFKRSPRILGRAFGPRSVVMFLIGFVFFAVIPYFLIVTKTPVESAWLDAGLLVGRLLLAALFSLIGWVVTVGAIGQRREASGTISMAQQNEGSGHVAAEA